MFCTVYDLNKIFLTWCLVFCTTLIAQQNQKIQVVFTGNSQYKQDDLFPIVEEEYNKFVEKDDVSYIDDAAYKLLNYYRNNGYHFANVDYDVSNNRVTFDIVENNPVILRDVKIVSKNQVPLSYPLERLRKFITPPPTIGKRYFKKSQVESDASGIAGFYLSEGYFQAKTQVKYTYDPAPPASLAVDATISITEGPRSFLDDIAFSGNEAFDENQLLSLLKFESGKIYLPRVHQTMAIKIKDFYRVHGYARVKVNPVVTEKLDNEKRESRTILFKITEQRRNYIRRITVEGNELSDEKIIRQQLEIYEMGHYSLEKIRKSEDNLQKTGLFLLVEIEETPVEDKFIDLNVRVKERDTRTVSLSAGYETNFGPLAEITYENINLYGTGLKFIFTVGTTFYTGDLGYSEVVGSIIEPYLFGERSWEFQFDAFVKNREDISFINFAYGSEFTFRKKLFDSVSIDFGYNFTISDAEDKNIDDNIETIFSALKQRIVFDFRNDPLFPTSGSYHFIEFEENSTYLGADDDFYRVYIHTAWYFNILNLEYAGMTHKWVLALAVRGGVIVPYGDTQFIPVERRFLSGGPDTIRSFQQSEVPTLDADGNAVVNEDGDPVGGEGVFIASVELRIPVYGNFGISGFMDTGKVTEQVRQFKDYNFDNLEYAIGVGIWYHTPIGPIRFDYAVNPDVEGNEDDYAWFISIGFSF